MNHALKGFIKEPYKNPFDNPKRVLCKEPWKGFFKEPLKGSIYEAAQITLEDYI